MVDATLYYHPLHPLLPNTHLLSLLFLYQIMLNFQSCGIILLIKREGLIE